MKTKTDDLFLINALARRRPLLPDEQDFYQKLIMGKQGEEAFANLFHEICPGLDLILDFQMQVYGQDLQIDALVCTEKKLYHFEIKNYDFDFTFRKGKAYIGKSRKEIANPFRQLKRSQDLLQQLLKNYPEGIELVSLVIFINENSQVTVDETCDSICLSRQDTINFFRKLFYGSQANPALQNWLTLQDRPLNSLYYTYEKLEMTRPVKSGLLCPKCGSKMHEADRLFLACDSCEKLLKKKEVKKDLIKEYALLFPWQTLYSTKIAAFYNSVLTKGFVYKALLETCEKASSKRRSGFLNPYSLDYDLADLIRRKNHSRKN